MTSKVQSFPSVTDAQRAQLAAAASLYEKHLRGLAEKARELGKETDAKAWETEAEGVVAEVLPKLTATDGALQLRGHEVKLLERGLAFFLKNLRAAKGTVRGLGKYKLAEEFEDEAVAVEGALVPLFAEQTSIV